METITHENWMKKAEQLFGKDVRKWEFICPSCGTVQTPQELLDTGMTKKSAGAYIGFSCIGRFNDKRGCNWTLGGLLRIHKLEIVIKGKKNAPVFLFNEERN